MLCYVAMFYEVQDREKLLVLKSHGYLLVPSKDLYEIIYQYIYIYIGIYYIGK